LEGPVGLGDLDYSEGIHSCLHELSNALLSSWQASAVGCGRGCGLSVAASVAAEKAEEDQDPPPPPPPPHHHHLIIVMIISILLPVTRTLVPGVGVGAEVALPAPVAESVTAEKAKEVDE
jgi:hypothetical protein